MGAKYFKKTSDMYKTATPGPLRLVAKNKDQVVSDGLMDALHSAMQRREKNKLVMWMAKCETTPPARDTRFSAVLPRAMIL